MHRSVPPCDPAMIAAALLAGVQVKVCEHQGELRPGAKEDL